MTTIGLQHDTVMNARFRVLYRLTSRQLAALAKPIVQWDLDQVGLGLKEWRASKEAARA